MDWLDLFLQEPIISRLCRFLTLREVASLRVCKDLRCIPQPIYVLKSRDYCQILILRLVGLCSKEKDIYLPALNSHYMRLGSAILKEGTLYGVLESCAKYNADKTMDHIMELIPYNQIQLLESGIQHLIAVAAVSDSVKVLIFLLARFSIEDLDALIILAVSNGSAETAKYLLSTEKGLEAIRGLDMSGLMFDAILKEDLKMVRVLLESGVPADYDCLEHAVILGDRQIAKTLLKAGAPLNHLNRRILLTAVDSNDADMVKLLMQYGADPTLVDNHRMDAFQMASETQRYNILRILKGQKDQTFGPLNLSEIKDSLNILIRSKTIQGIIGINLLAMLLLFLQMYYWGS